MKTLQLFLVALTKPEGIRVTYAHRSNIGNLIFKGGEYVGCEELINLDKDTSFLSGDDYMNIYDLLRRADIFGSISAPITGNDKIDIMSALITLYNENPDASKSEFLDLYHERVAAISGTN